MCEECDWLGAWIAEVRLPPPSVSGSAPGLEVRLFYGTVARGTNDGELAALADLWDGLRQWPKAARGLNIKHMTEPCRIEIVWRVESPGTDFL